MLRHTTLLCSILGSFALSHVDSGVVEAGGLAVATASATEVAVRDSRDYRPGYVDAASRNNERASMGAVRVEAHRASRMDGTPFSADVTVRDAQGLERVLEFGTVLGATAGYDHGTDVFAPPPPPSGFYAHIFTGGDRYFSDYRAPGAPTTEWDVRLQSDLAGQPLTLEWDPADFPSEGDMRLVDGFDLPIINVDMRQQSEFIVPNENTRLKIVYRPVVESVSLASPADLAANRPTQDTLKWRPLDGYTSYHVQLSATADLSSPLVDVFGITDTSYAVSSLAPEKTYFWRVRAIKPGISSTWSPVWRFTTGNADGGYPFMADLTVRDAGSGESILRFGTADDASDAFDSVHDVLAPPLPPDGFFDARFETGGDSYLTDIRATGAEATEWEVRFREGLDGRPISLAWDPSDLPAVGNVLLTNTAAGSAVHVDMMRQSAFTVPNDVSALRIVYGPEPPVVARTIDAAAGWNLIGLPVQVDDASRTTLLPNALPNSLFRSSNGYKLSDSLRIGEGYWIRYENADATVIVGQLVAGNTIELSEGWNLISGLSCSVSVSSISDPGSVVMSSTVYGFDAGYVLSDSLHPGAGYWVRATGADYIGLACEDAGSGQKQSAPALARQLAKLNRLDFSDGSRIAGSLYFGNERAAEVNAEDLLLPPTPPAGAFDVRFADDRRGFTWSDRAGTIRETILLQTPLGTVTVHASVQDAGWTYSLEALRQGKVTATYDVEHGGSFKIVGADRLRLVGFRTSELPSTVELEQNYPNPFNPVTNIRYGLPQESDVKLTIFNVLGQRILTLVDGRQKAGWHDVPFDGANLPSGVYYYILDAAGSREAKQLVLVK